MRKLLVTVSTAFLLTLSVHGQLSLTPSVVASAGDYAETASLNISYTLGELAIATLSGGDMILTQGFQQPKVIGVGINTEEVNWEIIAYPNPVKEILFVKFNLDWAREFFIEIQDVTGRVISLEQHKEILPGDVIQLNTSSFASGVYILKVFTPYEDQQQVLSIRKL